MAVPTIHGTIFDNIAWIVVLVPGLIAGVVMLFRRWRVAALYVALYMLFLTIWSWRQERFVLPLVPLLVPALLVGWSMLISRYNKSAARLAVGALAALLVLGGLLRTAPAVAAVRGCHVRSGMPPDRCLTPDQVSYFQALRYVDENLPRDAVLLTAKSGALWEFTGRRSISYGGAMAQGAKGFVPYLRQQGAGWILLASLEMAEYTRLSREMEANCGALQLEARFPERTYLFRVMDGTGDTPDSPACAAVKAYREANAKHDFSGE